MNLNSSKPPWIYLGQLHDHRRGSSGMIKALNSWWTSADVLWTYHEMVRCERKLFDGSGHANASGLSQAYQMSTQIWVKRWTQLLFIFDHAETSLMAPFAALNLPFLTLDPFLALPVVFLAFTSNSTASTFPLTRVIMSIDLLLLTDQCSQYHR